MKSSSVFRKKTISQIRQQSEQGDHPPLAKHLGARDLTALGIAAIIGGLIALIGIIILWNNIPTARAAADNGLTDDIAQGLVIWGILFTIAGIIIIVLSRAFHKIK